MYEVSINVYEASKNDKNCKPIEVKDKEIYLSVGGYLSFNNKLPYSLLIHVHYDKDTIKELTTNIAELKSFEPYIAINPDFKDKELIDRLKDLSILSDTIEIVNKDNKKYEIVEVNIEELKDYKPFGDTILKDYKNKEKEINM